MAVQDLQTEPQSGAPHGATLDSRGEVHNSTRDAELQRLCHEDVTHAARCRATGRYLLLTTSADGLASE